MTLEQAILVFQAATEELQRHSAITITFRESNGTEIQLYELNQLLQLPGELTVEKCKSLLNPFQASKTFAGIEMVCLCRTDPREEETNL